MRTKPKYKNKVCPICGIEFTPTHNIQDFCTKTCQMKHANKIQSEYKKEWARVNKDRLKKLAKVWLSNNPEKRKQASDKYRKAHKEYYAMYARLRKIAKTKACPPWADLVEIKCIYQEADYFQLEVDHIIPIKHKLVCGLHVPDNLQLLSRSENAKKSNKFRNDVDILGVVTDE